MASRKIRLSSKKAEIIKLKRKVTPPLPKYSPNSTPKYSPNIIKSPGQKSGYNHFHIQCKHLLFKSNKKVPFTIPCD